MKNIIHPKFSVIVASRNSEKSIEKTIQSLQSQNYPNMEVVFVDGCSTDRTIDLIKNANFANSILISERDCGIGEAWNKGLKICTGEIIGILNSDDYYECDMFLKIIPYFSNPDMPLIGFGDVTLINPDDGGRRKIIGKMRSKLGLLNGFGFLHPSVFFNRRALDVNGSFNPRISVAMDVDWLLRAIKNKIVFEKIPSHTYMQIGGLSYVNKFTGMGEYMDSLVRNGYSKIHMAIFLLFRCAGSFLRVFRE
jgi:glycosyltransferase involved in cell wall biosynthesis